MLGKFQWVVVEIIVILINRSRTVQFSWRDCCGVVVGGNIDTRFCNSGESIDDNLSSWREMRGMMLPQAETMQENFSGLSSKSAKILFWTTVSSFAIIWAVLPVLFHTGYRNDVVEILFVGKEWVLANHKHPALSAWMPEIVGWLTNRAFIAPFLVGQLCTVVTVWSVWQLARCVLNEKQALIAALAILPVRLLTNESVLYNHNLVLLAFYAWSVYFAFQAFQTNRIFYWIAAGIAVGLGLHNKYPAILPTFGILLYMTLRPAGRQYWFRVGPYLSIGLALIIFLPHIVWLFHNDFPTRGYASAVATGRSQSQILYHFIYPLRFAASQPLYWIPTMVVLLPALGWPWKWKRNIRETARGEHPHEKAKECERFLFYCCIVPILVFIAVCSGGIHLRMVYGAPFWCFLSVWLLLRFQVNDHPRLLARTILCLIAAETVVIADFPLTFFQGKQPAPVYLPMNALASECERIWQEQHFNVPCPYVTGDMILAGHAAWRMPNRPTVHYHASSWSSDEMVNQNGGIILWPMEGDVVPSWVQARFPRAKLLPPDTLVLASPHPRVKGHASPLPVGIAVIPPP